MNMYGRQLLEDHDQTNKFYAGAKSDGVVDGVNKCYDKFFIVFIIFLALFGQLS